MKTLFSTFLIIAVLVSCNCQKAATNKSNLKANEAMKQTQEMPVLEYEAMSRGFYQKISIENNKVIVTSGRDSKPIGFDISEDDLNQLVELYDKVDKEGLKDLKDPTQKRFYDGAPIAKFRIIEGDVTYETTDFDGGFPPAEIKEIVEKVIQVSQKKI
jgi:hypothetical protein